MMKNQKQYDDSQWRTKIKFANKVFNQGDRVLSAQYYQVAIDMGQKLYVDYKNMEPLPDALTPMLVVSYLNLSDCWAEQNKKKEQLLCLIEVYDFLREIVHHKSSSLALIKQAYQGLSKVFIELCTCFRDIDAQQILLKVEKNFSELSVFYQDLLTHNKSETVH